MGHRSWAQEGGTPLPQTLPLPGQLLLWVGEPHYLRHSEQHANMLGRAYKVGSRLQKVNIFLFSCFLQLLWYLLQEALLVPHEGPEINKLL